MEPRRPRGRRLLPGARSRSGSTSAARRSSGRRSAGCCPCSCSTATRGSSRCCSRTCRAPSASATSRANVGALRAHLPADLVFANHVLMGGAGRGRDRRALRGQGARLGARVLDARQRGAARPGARGRSPARRRRLRRLGAHPRGARGGRRPRRPRPRGAAGRRRRRVPAAAARRGARRRCSRRRAPTRRTPATAQERLPDEGNARRLAEFFAGERPIVLYFGKLLYNKGVHVLLEALRGMDARTVIVGFGDYRARAGADRAAADALHRPARAPPPRRTCSRSPTSPSCRRSSRRRSGWSRPRRRPPAARRSSRGTRASRRSPQGSSRRTRPSCATSRASRPATRSTSRDKLHELLALPRPRVATELGARRPRKVAVERWSWAGVADACSSRCHVGFSLQWVKRRAFPTSSCSSSRARRSRAAPT